MTEQQKDNQELRHKLRNVEQEKLALKGALKRAADEIDELAESDCEDENKDKAQRHAEQFKKMAEQ